MANTDQFGHVEGQWEDLMRHSDQFAGRRVRVTVLSDDRATDTGMQNEIRRWLAEGKALETMSPANPKPSAFGDALVEKFRRQGLVL